MPVRILIPSVTRVTSPSKIVPRKWKEDGIYKRLPNFYKESYIERISKLPQPVHFIPNDKKYLVNHETGEKKRVQDAPIVVLYPKESKLGIWGGEGVIAGYKRPKKQSGYTRPQTLNTKLWRPRVLKVLFYSEILNKYYALTCTRRTLNLIEEAKGFDHYILKTHLVDLNSDFATEMKREMLIKLAKKDTDLYPDDPAQRDAIYQRYKEYEIPLEQAEWFGLYPWEAATKQKKIEEEQLKASIKPWKEKFSQELKAYLETLKIEGKEFPEPKPEPKPLSLRQNIMKEVKSKIFKEKE